MTKSKKVTDQGPREMHKPCEGCGKPITATLSTKLCSTCQSHANDAQHPNSVRQVGLRRRGA
jgi:hypothetical protein